MNVEICPNGDGKTYLVTLVSERLRHADWC